MLYHRKCRSVASVDSLCHCVLQAALLDVNSLMDQGKYYNSETKIALEVATLGVSVP